MEVCLWHEFARYVSLLALRYRSDDRRDFLVGERPFVGQTHHEILTSLLHSEYHLPGSSIEIRALDAVVQRCLAKDPRDRHTRRPRSKPRALTRQL